MENILTPEEQIKIHDSLLKKFFGLWAVVYVYAFMATSQFSIPIPFLEQFVVWFGKTFLHLEDLHKITNTGSGDTTYDFVLILVITILSLLITIIILFIDRKRASYRSLYLFTIVIARYYVAFTMITYGFAKLFDGQFPANGYSRLEEKVGDMSPMGMVWAFMGASRAYTFVSGLLEFTGGVLLLFRKTKTIGALFSMAVMLNVALLNYMYDVPVKIFSTHIVLLCIFILTFDWKLLYNFFIRHRTEKLYYNKLRAPKKWMQISLRVIKILFIVVMLNNNYYYLQRAFNKQPLPMEGYYAVNTFILNHDTLPVIANKKDTVGWSKMFIQYPGSVSVKLNSDTTIWKKVKVDTVKKTFNISNYDSTQYALLNYTMRNDTVAFNGTIKNDTATIIFIRKQKKDYSLSGRGFHWINEYPPNW
ncbi:DoxX family protein [Parafilimonas terrae]|nr:hypothetical protein [Parafilimonas terrae]